VEVALAPELVWGLGERPVVERGSDAAGDGLGFPGAVVMAEAVVGEAEGLGEHSAFAAVVGEESLDAAVAVAAAGFDAAVEVVDGDEREAGVAQLGILVLGRRQNPFGSKLTVLSVIQALGMSMPFNIIRKIKARSGVSGLDIISHRQSQRIPGDQSSALLAEESTTSRRSRVIAHLSSTRRRGSERHIGRGRARLRDQTPTL